MLSFVQSFFAPKSNPIGLDFGSETIRLAQVRRVDNDFRLIAAASADIPSTVRHDPQARVAFLVEAMRDLLPQGKFQGRQVVLSLPAASMFIQHLRLAKMDEEARTKAIPWEVRGKLPIDPMHALLRHHVAGEVYQDQEPREEVILMAAAKELVNGILSAAAKARLDVVGMETEPKALLDCFGHVYRRKTDADVTNCFVDIGSTSTRAVVAKAGHILFARTIPVGGEHFNRAVAAALKIPVEEARLLRMKLAGVGLSPAAIAAAAPKAAAPKPAPNAVPASVEAPAASGAGDENNSFALLSASMARAEQSERRSPGPSDPQLAIAAEKAAAEAPAPVPAAAPEVAAGAEMPAQAHEVDAAMRDALSKLVQELDLCRRYYEATFPSQPIDRLVFVGGEAHQRRVCQQIAMELSLAAQVGDPMVRMAKTSQLPAECGMDVREPQPSWAVAIGLSMGALSAVPQEIGV